MSKHLLAAILMAATLSGCVTPVCPAYRDNLKYQKPLHKPRFRKDPGHQGDKYSSAARKAAEQTDAALYLSTLKVLSPQ
ncbi:hypothetical protein [uncultured Pontibacter sp.]|uniref:hypothetical protein n=1 Tax=uncultured Pontibacter sp. TaxID=453356 RepID=UPI00262B2A61|nr:hypothetical protein [uncultured Pontibacter sp.]